MSVMDAGAEAGDAGQSTTKSAGNAVRNQAPRTEQSPSLTSSEMEKLRPGITVKSYPIARQFGHRFHDGRPWSPPQFEAARRLVADLQALVATRGDEGAKYLADEATIRIEHLEWMIKRVVRLQELEHRSSARHWSPDTSPAARLRAHRRRARSRDDRAREIGILTEGFYYCAFRLAKIVSHVTEKRGSRRFMPMGVCRVRNDVIEHAETVAWSVVCGRDMPWGPVLRPFGPRGDTPQDNGLYANAQAYLDELERYLARYINLAKADADHRRARTRR